MEHRINVWPDWLSFRLMVTTKGSPESVSVWTLSHKRKLDRLSWSDVTDPRKCDLGGKLLESREKRSGRVQRGAARVRLMEGGGTARETSG